MALINVSNLTFSYDGGTNIFDNTSFQIDTDWKLGFVGRNGRGKTTFLNLLMNKYEYRGTITTSVEFDYFPFNVKEKTKNAYEIAKDIVPDYLQWALDKELNLLECSQDCRWRAFDTLSGGEQTKILLAILFLKNNNFLLIDEPTNHLDAEARIAVSKYLNSKKGFILVSHDREFLDGCVNHILSINKANIEVRNGNFSQWLQNKERQDNFELAQNEKLAGEIDRLKYAARQKTGWSFHAEDKKKGAADKGFMGAKAARQMKTAKIIERRREKAVEDKMKLLNNIEDAEDLMMTPQEHLGERLVTASNLSIKYKDKTVFGKLNFHINQGERIAVIGKNGAGKSSLLKLLTGDEIKYDGTLSLAGSLKVSYIPQDTSLLKGTPKEFAAKCDLNEIIFIGTLFKLDISRDLFDKDMKDFSEGQKKKILLAKSICENAHLYIWDEPLNYIDILSRMQVVKLIQKYCPTLLFVEHDNTFTKTIATKVVSL